MAWFIICIHKSKFENSTFAVLCVDTPPSWLGLLTTTGKRCHWASITHTGVDVSLRRDSSVGYANAVNQLYL